MNKTFIISSPFSDEKMNCSLEARTYPNDRLALQLYSFEDGFKMPYATLTTNLPEVPLKDNCVAVKNTERSFFDTKENKLFEEVCESLGVKIEKINTIQYNMNVYDIYRINDPEVLKEKIDVGDATGIDKAIARSNKENEWAKESEQVIETGKKITREEALEKLNSGEWDNERYNDAWFSGEIAEADEEPEEIGHFDDTDDYDSED